MAIRVPADVIPYARFIGVRIEEDEHGTRCVLPSNNFPSAFGED